MGLNRGGRYSVRNTLKFTPIEKGSKVHPWHVLALVGVLVLTGTLGDGPWDMFLHVSQSKRARPEPRVQGQLRRKLN